MLAFTAKKLITPTETVEHPVVLVADGKIVEIAGRTGAVRCRLELRPRPGDSMIAAGLP